MSGNGANLILFNERNKDWTCRALAILHPLTSDNISFLPYPLTPTPLKVEVTCVSPPLFVIKVSNLN